MPRPNRLRSDMTHIKSVLRMLEPGFDTRRIAVKRRNNPNPLFKRGTIFRAVLDVLRTAPEPMTAEEIGVALMHSKGLAEPSRDDRRRMWGAVASSLRNERGKDRGGDRRAAEAVANSATTRADRL